MKSTFEKNNIQFFLQIGGLWLSLAIFNSFISFPRTFAQSSLNEVWRAVFLVFANYVFFELFLPIILKKRINILVTILIGILLLPLQLFIISFGLYFWCSLGVGLNIYTQFRQSTILPGGFNQLMDNVFFEAETGILSMFFFGAAKLFQHNFNLRQAAQQLRLEKQEAELNYLKSQTNPHFLFNTLNNIYSLARDKNDLAPESILRLSKILRFMLYETSGKFINVEQEVEIIKDYIALEKLRYDDTLRITFACEIEDIKQTMPPLLLIPLIENAFKHGASESGDGAFVDIHLTINQQQLKFIVKNSAEDTDEQKTIKENIGLSNLRRQLHLLFKTHNLIIKQERNIFIASLMINLSTYVEN